MSDEWAAALKPGDTVLVSRGSAGYSIKTVDVAGKVHITVAGEKYLRRTLRRVNDDRWSYTILVEATQERLAQIHEKSRRTQLLWKVRSGIENLNLSLETLEAIAALLDQEKAQKQAEEQP